MNYRSYCIATLAMLSFSTFAMAGFSQGDKEFTLSGGGNSSSDFGAANVTANFGLGWFLTNRLELAVRQSVGYSDPGDNAKDTLSGSTRGAIDYNFDFGTFVPYAGVNVGYSYGTNHVNDTGEAAPELGIKWFVNDTTFLYGQMEYQFFFQKDDNANDAFKDGQFVYTLGIGVRW